MFYRISDIQPRVDELFKNGIAKGAYMGFDCLKDYYSVKLGCTTYICGIPTVGKSSFWFEMLINLSEFYGWKHAIFTPETGNVEEVIAELCACYIQRPFFKTYPNAMSEQEKYKALSWLNEHFFIADPKDEALSIEKFYSAIDDIEKKYEIKINTTTADPFNELTHDFSDHNNRQDLYIEHLLGLVRRNARTTGRHNCIITHVAQQQLVKEGNVSYYPAPTARDYAGGQAWYRKGLGMIALWRPPLGLNDQDGRPYQDNEVHVIIQKAKPKGIGQKGVVKLFFNLNRSRYYEIDSNGQMLYAHKESASPIEKMSPVLDYTLPMNQQINSDDVPF